MRREDIPKFARCATESYGSISYALDDYFVGHPRTKEELWEMWIFNLKYFYSRALIYSDSRDCNAWLLWVPPGCKGLSMVDFLRYGGIGLTLKLGIASMKRIVHYEDYSAYVRLNATGGHECLSFGRRLRDGIWIYRHFGFEVVSDDPIPGTGVTHWGMMKQP
ncbi:MAG: hypothetical protein MJY45_06450 [Bacteroidales bacterium]|nr:hypothetical protein [Bacteroidales bacterium]